jgi:hypothetical protein
VASAEVVAGFATTGRHLAETPKVCLEEVSAGELAVLIPQRDQPPQVQRDLIGLGVVRVLYLC